jgi:hypothetical protein
MRLADANAIQTLLVEAAEHMAEAVKQAGFAYRYCPGAYTFAAMQTCLTAAKRLNRCRALAALAAPAEPPAPASTDQPRPRDLLL